MPCEALTWVEFRAQERRLDCLFSNASSVACLIYPGQNTSLQFSRVAQSCPTHCDPRDYRTSGLLVHHQLREFTQTHIRWVGDAIQPSHPLLSPSLAFSLSLHPGLFQWKGSSYQVAKVLKLQLHHQSSNQYTGWYPLKLTGLISLLSKGLSRVFSCTTIRKHQFFGAQLSKKKKKKKERKGGDI